MNKKKRSATCRFKPSLIKKSSSDFPYFEEENRGRFKIHTRNYYKNG